MKVDVNNVINRRNALKAAEGARRLGSVAKKINSSRLGAVMGAGAVKNPKLAVVYGASKAVQKYAPKVGNAIEAGVAGVEEFKRKFNDLEMADGEE